MRPVGFATRAARALHHGTKSCETIFAELVFFYATEGLLQEF